MALSREQFGALRAKGLSTEQIIRFESGNKPQQGVGNLGEAAISKRQSFLGKPINALDLTPLGGKRMVPESLRAIGAGLEVAEGVPASIGLDIQRATETGGKSIKDIPSNIAKVFKGERPAQFGDIYRGAGVPEPLAATGGLLAAAHPKMPSGALGDLIGKAIGKPISAIGRAAKPGVAKTMSFLSGTPARSVETAMDNPKVLSGGYIKKRALEAGAGMENKVKPLVNDPNAMVPITQKIQSIGNDLGWHTPAGQETRALAEVSRVERRRLLDWAKRIDNGQGSINFNEADKVIAEIDSSLNKFYDKKYTASIPPITKSFERQAIHIRRAVDEARKQAFPNAGSAIDDYSKFAKERQANMDFSRWSPRGLGQKLGSGVGSVGIGLLLKSLPLGAAGFSLTSPYLQGQLIRGASTVGRNIASAPAVTGISLKELARRKKD